MKNLRCVKCGREFYPATVQKCKYSKSGALVCMYCCQRRCKYAQPHPNGMRCGYNNAKQIQQP
nr:MAG TPA: Transcription initiation factor IIE, alpha FINGER, Transcription [Bacteriophage sp.]